VAVKTLIKPNELGRLINGDHIDTMTFIIRRLSTDEIFYLCI